MSSLSYQDVCYLSLSSDNNDAYTSFVMSTLFLGEMNFKFRANTPPLSSIPIAYDYFNNVYHLLSTYQRIDMFNLCPRLLRKPVIQNDTKDLKTFHLNAVKT
jgi:hypothetical protein